MCNCRAALLCPPRGRRGSLRFIVRLSAIGSGGGDSDAPIARKASLGDGRLQLEGEAPPELQAPGSRLLGRGLLGGLGGDLQAMGPC